MRTRYISVGQVVRDKITDQEVTIVKKKPNSRGRRVDFNVRMPDGVTEFRLARDLEEIKDA